MNIFRQTGLRLSGCVVPRWCAAVARRRWSTLFALVLLATPLPGAAANVLTLESAQAIALAENPGIAEMRARYEAMLQLAPQRASLPDPTVSFGAMNFPWDEFDRQQEPMTQLQVGISQVFPFPGKLGIREDIALLEAEAASHAVDEGRINLARNVALTWWELYYLDRALATVQKNLTLLRQLVDMANTRYEVGEGLQQDVLLAQLELSKALDSEIQIASLRDQTRISLNLLLGRLPETDVELPLAAVPQLRSIRDANTLVELASASRPALAGQRSRIAAAESRLELARKDYYPDLMVGVTYGDRDEDSLGHARQDFLSVQLSVSLPLFTGGKQDRAVQQRSREVASSRYALTDSLHQVRSLIAQSIVDYRRATTQLELFDHGVIPQARQTVESMKAGYQVGQVDFLNLVRSQVTLFNYELRYWKSVSEASKALARLAAAVGQENIYE